MKTTDRYIRELLNRTYKLGLEIGVNVSNWSPELIEDAMLELHGQNWEHDFCTADNDLDADVEDLFDIVVEYLEQLEEENQEDSYQEEDREMDLQMQMDNIDNIVNSLHVGYNFVEGVGAGYASNEEDLNKMKEFVRGFLMAHLGMAMMHTGGVPKDLIF